MNILLFFISGIVFIQCILPLLEALVSLIITNLKLREAVAADKYNKIAQEAADREAPKRAIGFVTSNEDYEEEVDEE